MSYYEEDIEYTEREREHQEKLERKMKKLYKDMKAISKGDESRRVIALRAMFQSPLKIRRRSLKKIVK